MLPSSVRSGIRAWSDAAPDGAGTNKATSIYKHYAPYGAGKRQLVQIPMDAIISGVHPGRNQDNFWRICKSLIASSNRNQALLFYHQNVSFNANWITRDDSPVWMMVWVEGGETAAQQVWAKTAERMLGDPDEASRGLSKFA